MIADPNAGPDSEEGASRRFDLGLLIMHPTLEPAEISAAFGLEAHLAHRVGDRRKTPKGTLLPGSYRDTRWRHSVRHEVTDQWFAGAVAELVDRLKPHRTFLRSLRSSGGSACIVIQFLGDGHFGDQLAQETLAALADLDLELGIECFSCPQS